MRGFPDAPFGFEFLPVKAYTLRKLDNDGQPSGAEFNVLPQDLVEATKWQRYAPKRQLKVTSRTHGLCMYVKAERDVELKKVYAYVQSTPLGEIRARQLWNVVVAYQFVVHTSVTSESLAETVGSFLHNLQTNALGSCVPRNS